MRKREKEVDDRVKGSDLIFISWIKRDGSGTEPMNEVDERALSYLQDEFFDIRCLSLSEETYIASAFNSYVVKFKN